MPITAPTWRIPPSPTGSNQPQTPTFSGTTAAFAASGTASPVASVHLLCTRTSDGVVVYDAIFDLTATEKSQGYFSRAPVTLDGNRIHTARFRNKNELGEWTPFSSVLTFTTAAGPNAPTLSSPSGKINSISGYNYQGTYNHSGGLSSNAIEVEVWDSKGLSRLYASGTTAMTVAPGMAFSLAEFHTDLAWATKYSWRARFRDTSNNWGAWATRKSFNTNANPSIPTGLTPAQDQVVTMRDFSATVSDPDGDPVTAAEMELVRISTGAVVAGATRRL